MTSEILNWIFVILALLIVLWVFFPKKCKYCNKRKGFILNSNGIMAWLNCKSCGARND
jgi:hypothetical protein